MKQTKPTNFGEAPRYREVWRVYTNKVRCAAFSPDMRYILSGGNDGLRLWEIISQIKSQERSRVQTEMDLKSGGYHGDAAPDGSGVVQGITKQ